MALNHEEIKKYLQRITKIKNFANNWEALNYLSEKDFWKKFEKNNLTIALNVLYTKKKKNTYQIVNSKLFFQRFQRRIPLYCSKKITYIIKKNNV